MTPSAPAPRQTSLTGVSGQFTARHIDPHLGEGEHEHTWHVVAWYPAEPFRDARCLREALHQVLSVWNGTLLPPEMWSAEAIAKAITRLLANCVGADVNRPAEGFYAQYRSEYMTDSRYKQGGLEPRFIVERLDGQPIPSDRRYSLVLDFSGRDPHAVFAAKAYADSVRAENPQLADDILAAVADPSKAPAQHRYA